MVNAINFQSQQSEKHHTIYEAITDVDDRLASNLDPDVVCAYVTCELEPHGDYMNLVVFMPGKTADDFLESPIHKEALKIAPFYYDFVRIHRITLSLWTLKYYIEGFQLLRNLN